MPTPRDLDDSDDLTELQKRGWREEPPLIDFGDDNPVEAEKHIEPRPTDRLKMLLRQMEIEVMDSRPPEQTAQPTRHYEVEDEEVKPEPRWRAGRRLGLRRDEVLREEMISSPERSPAEAEDDEEEQESPPTPPLRLTNQYSARRNDCQCDIERGYVHELTPAAHAGPSSSHRLPSRAAVLRNST
jgi:hypothetical protein